MLVVALGPLSACSKPAGRKGPLLRWKLRAKESLVYRYELERSRTLTSGKTHTEKERGELRVDGNKDGEARLVFEPARAFAMMPESQLKLVHDKDSLLFPLPPAALTRELQRHTWQIKGLGGASNVAVPAFEVKDEVKLLGVEAGVARLAWTRKIGLVMPKVTKALQMTQTIEEQGTGSFDLKAGRYISVSAKQKTEFELGTGGKERKRGVLLGSLQLTLDLPRSQQRTALRKTGAEPPDVAAYLRQHPMAKELRAVIDAWLKAKQPMPTAALYFHLQAHPRRTWLEGLASHRSAKDRQAFAQGMTLVYASGKKLPDSVVLLLRGRMAQEPAMQAFVAQRADPRLAELHRILSRSKDEALAKRARRALGKLEQRARQASPQALLALAKDPRAFVKAGHHLLFSSADPKALVEVLIRILKRKDTATFNRQLCVQWLEGIARRALGSDVAAWEAFWQQNKARPFSAWLVDAARQKTPLLRLNALMGLATQLPFRAGLKELLSGLKASEDRVRLQAAVALARWRDGRAVAVLLAFLEHSQAAYRQTAFIALAAFHDTTLGYDPQGKEAERTLALRRWKAWAAQAKLPKVLPQR